MELRKTGGNPQLACGSVPNHWSIREQQLSSEVLFLELIKSKIAERISSFVSSLDSLRIVLTDGLGSNLFFASVKTTRKAKVANLELMCEVL